MFWETISKLRGEPEDRAQMLEQVMATWSPEERREFGLEFYKRHQAAYTWDLWGAGYILDGGMSDDSFMDFRGWLISQGQEVYEGALRNPDSLAAIAVPYEVTNEDFLYVATTGVSDADAAQLTWPSEPTGTDWKEEDLPARFPKIWALVEGTD